jgi:hypothetical protein
MLNKFTFFIRISFLLVVIMSIASCGGDEEVVGCTDSRADNYNANATSDSGTCVYPNEKFFGTYSGSFTCPVPFDAINDSSVEFKLTPPANANDVNKVTVSATITGIPLSLDGDIDGDKIVFVDKTINNISIQGITTDISFSGQATLSGNTLTANITVGAVVVIPLSGACTFTGTKQ